MKRIIISDNQYYLNAFTNINCSKTVTSDLAFVVNSAVYDGAIVIVNITDNAAMLKILDELIKMNILKIFVEQFQWPRRVKLTSLSNIYILPGRMDIDQFLETIEKCLLSLSDVVQIRPDRVRGSEWITMLYLMSGISNRHLAQILNTSEKTISGRMNSLSIKMGLTGLNKATQLIAMNFFYLIYISTKPVAERRYFTRIQRDILESVSK
ncbi:hypothetical protein ACLIKC_25375 [Klebsiella aerogenes]|uniref:hypothetical protein n=1 Tax=Klebsiella aerogenes TaxID=548 RepID=UPI003A90F18F